MLRGGSAIPDPVDGQPDRGRLDTANDIRVEGNEIIGELRSIDSSTKVDIVKGNTLTVHGGNFAGVISGVNPAGVTSTTLRAGLTKTGAGTLTLSGANTYTGLTTVSNGTLRISHNTALGGGTGSQARTIVASGARLELSSSGTTGLNVGRNPGSLWHAGQPQR